MRTLGVDIRKWAWLVLVVSGAACGNGASDSAGSGSAAGVAGSSGSTGGGGVPAGGAAAGTSGTGISGTPSDGGKAASAGSGGGAVPVGGTSPATGGATGGAIAGTGGAPTVGLCPEAPTPRLSSGTVLQMPIRLALEGKPLLFAEENIVAGGGTLTPLDVRFYVSEVALLRQGAAPLPVDIVTPDGAVAPYGVHFYNADDLASTTLRVLAPAGEYTGITFLFGLAQPCNVRNPELAKAPLSATSQMTWPHTGYLFWRYQGRYAASTGGTNTGGANTGGANTGGASTDGVDAAFPAVIHMGGSLFEALAPTIRIDAALSVPPAGEFSKTLQVAMDQVFKGALSEVDLTGFAGPPGEEVVLGERLRRSLPTLNVFSFEP